MRLAARFGQGWVTSGLGGDDRAQWWSGSPRWRHGSTTWRLGRRWTGISCWTRRATGRCARAAEFVDEAGGGELGFTDVVIHWPRPEGWYAGDEATLEAIAAARRSS